MLGIEFRFLTGAFHGTPWGRHVNEADVEWPPSPWRIARALVATWHRKPPEGPYQRDDLEALLCAMAARPPSFHLPEALHAHTRHYMPTRESKSDKSTLVFDAFAHVDPNDPLVVVWPELELGGSAMALLDALLASLGYLGRAESWVSAKRVETIPGPCNCVPGHAGIDDETGEITEQITLLAPLPHPDYLAFRAGQSASVRARNLNTRDARAFARSLPASWLDAISVDTQDLRAAGWSAPPAAQATAYRRPPHSLRPARSPRARRPKAVPASLFRFALYGRPLPRVEDTVRVAEWLRAAVMRCAQKALGDAPIPPAISGHGTADRGNHEHAFWLPEDADDDGHIDHLLVYIPAGLVGAARTGVESLHRLWNRDGHEWQVLFEGSGPYTRFVDDGAPVSDLCQSSTVFESVTPYLMPWFAKKRFGLPDQIARECGVRGFSLPREIAPLARIRVAGRDRAALDFYRFRSKHGIVQPDSRGTFLRLTFPEPISGPLALGFGSHFGLGLFRPVSPPVSEAA